MTEEERQRPVFPPRPARPSEPGAGFLPALLDLADRLSATTAADLDAALEQAQRSICRHLDLARSALWQVSGENTRRLRLTHLHPPHPGPPPEPPGFPGESVSWTRRPVGDGTVAPLHEPFPDHVSEFAPVVSADGGLELPLSAEGRLLGVLTFQRPAGQDTWSGELVQELQLAARIVAAALARRRTDQALRTSDERLNEALAESERRFRATFEQAAFGIAHLDLDGRFLRFNGRFQDISGVPEGELMCRALRDITHPADWARANEQMDALLDGRIPSGTMEKRYLRGPGDPVWVSETVSLVRDGGGAPAWLVLVAVEITGRKSAEEELNRFRTQLWHAGRAAQIGVITASLAHELNQPLAAILTNAQAGLKFMAQSRPDLDEIRGILTDIVQDDKRAGAVVSGLRAMLRRRETVRETFPAAEAVREVLDLLHSEMLARHVRASLGVERDALLLADRTQIQQVLLNLAMNAIDAVQGQPPERRRIEITLVTSLEDELLITVRDWGAGVPGEQHARLFEPFWTTKESGMGIGLAISRSIIESHGGHLGYRDAPEGGAAFHFTLPARVAPH